MGEHPQAWKKKGEGQPTLREGRRRGVERGEGGGDPKFPPPPSSEFGESEAKHWGSEKGEDDDDEKFLVELALALAMEPDDESTTTCLPAANFTRAS